MKGSAVFQGFKDFVSKLHPQLPLTPKESSRLLTALTSSFRRQLDEAHPRVAADTAKSPLLGAKKGAHSLHSSATLADKHIASVLTSPLLSREHKVSKADRDYANIKLQLQNDEGKDPVALLEEAHEKGVATIEIAALCLGHYKASLDRLPQVAALKQIREVEPGRRTLRWLWESGMYTQEAFVEKHEFAESMTYFLLIEGHEPILWEWLQLDMVIAENPNHDRSLSAKKLGFHKYRWKGRVLRAMVTAQLQPPLCTNESADAAIRTFFKALQLAKNGRDNADCMQYLPLAAAGVTIDNALIGHAEHPRTDVQLFEDYIDTIPDWMDHPGFVMATTARAWLWHPTRPDPWPLYRFVSQFAPPAVVPPKYRWWQSTFFTPGPAQTRWAIEVQSAAILLEEQGHAAESQELKEQIRVNAPVNVMHWERDKMKNATRRAKLRSHTEAQTKSEEETVRVPFPTFSFGV